MKWSNRQFGEFEFLPEHVLTFPDGLIGFEQLQKYILINDEDSQPFLWLVSLEDADVSFPVIAPHAFVAKYDEEVHKKPDETMLVIVSLREKMEDSTVNLRSPIILANSMGRQVVLENDGYPFQYRFLKSASTAEKG
ncbi:MAG TPA: flagellar assembly protein FliW [Bacteroidota bacterium]|nr:flagellar assembly protein FliW [Bacteroidota bacterium]